MLTKAKPLVWMHGEVKSPPFSSSARLEAGFLLRNLQQGVSLNLPQSRPLPIIGKNCHELRIADKDSTWRIVYRIDSDAVIILEIFKKKTKETPRLVIETCKQRIKDYDNG